MKDLVLGIVLALPAMAQTQIDWRTQVKAKPIKTGTALPAACTTGDLFLKLDASSGRNLYACLSGNIWALQSGTGGLSVQVSGVAVGSEPVANFIGGAGILNAIADTGSRFDVASMVDSAVVQTHSNAQTGADLYCASQSGSGQNYTCAMTPTLSVLTKGMILHWNPDVTAVGGPTTLDIDALPPVSVKLAGGIADPTASDIIAGRLTTIWFDGVQFRLMNADGLTGANAARPVCAAALRGRIWFTPANSGIKDELAICLKDLADQYGWKVIY